MSDVEIIEDELDALGLLQSVYRSEGVPLNTRMRAAIAALPFERPKLAVVVTNREGDLAERLMAALAATNKVINSRPMQVIEHAPVDAGLPIDEVDHGKPFPMDSKSRFRRI